MQYFDLTTRQDNILKLQKYYADTAITNICGAVFFKEMREKEALRDAINRVIKNQSALRLRFVEHDGNVTQYVKDYSYVDIAEHVKEVIVSEKSGLIQAEVFLDKDIGTNVEKIIKEEIMSLNKGLPSYKKIQKVVFREQEFEKTTTRKIKRSS